WQYYDLYRKIEVIRPLYHSFIEKAADFLVSYRDEQTGLPLPSYDLWEERRGILSFTTAAVYGGLIAAANLSDIFYHTEKAKLYRQTAAQIKEAIDKHLYSEKHKRFLRMIYPKKEGGYEIDATIDASLYGMFAFGVYDSNDIKVRNTMKAIEETLWVKTKIGGIARYEHDMYQRAGEDDKIPGNPWIICTMWLAQYYASIAKSVEDLEHVVNYLRWAVSHALPSGVLAEQINPHTGEPVSVSPLTWSHAAVVQTVMDYLEKLQELHTCGQCGRSIFRYDRAGRQQVKNHALTHLGTISDREHIRYLDQINLKKGNESINVSVDQRQCVGCGICVVNSKGAMDVVEDKAKIIAERAVNWDIKSGFEKCCPLGAITVEKKHED
ncbi:MAG: glycoside hydrolase family 15 protein, partial [Planctomycetota bacterium]